MNKFQQLSLQFDEITGTKGAINLEEILGQIKAAPVRSDEEHMAVLVMIEDIKTKLDPMVVAMLQMESVMKLLNASQNQGAKEHSLAEVLLKFQETRKNNP
jgi:hypothetical protein